MSLIDRVMRVQLVSNRVLRFVRFISFMAIRVVVIFIALSFTEVSIVEDFLRKSIERKMVEAQYSTLGCFVSCWKSISFSFIVVRFRMLFRVLKRFRKEYFGFFRFSLVVLFFWRGMRFLWVVVLFVLVGRKRRLTDCRRVGVVVQSNIRFQFQGVSVSVQLSAQESRMFRVMFVSQRDISIFRCRGFISFDTQIQQVMEEREMAKLVVERFRISQVRELVRFRFRLFVNSIKLFSRMVCFLLQRSMRKFFIREARRVFRSRLFIRSFCFKQFSVKLSCRGSRAFDMIVSL